MIAVSSNVARPRERFEFWCDVVNRQLAPMRSERIGDAPFRGEVQANVVGDLSFARILAGGSRSSRSRYEVAKTRDHFFAVCMHVGGAAVLEREDESVVLKRGDIFVVDTMHPFSIGLERQVEQLIIKMPVRGIESRLARPDLLFGTVLRDHPLSPLLADYLVHGFRAADRLSPGAAATLAQHAVDLTAQTIEEGTASRPAPTEALREALFVRAERLIALRFAEPDLTPDRIARALSVSTRLLQRIFAEHGATMMGQVWEERVSQAAKLLAKPDASHRSITEIAFTCGFNDSAHFTRAFAARVAVTPSQWRRQALDGSQDRPMSPPNRGPRSI
jgi:AraC-like DNA-binding protein